jgi:hypothetical protein
MADDETKDGEAPVTEADIVRSFSRFFEMLSYGDVHDEASRKLTELMRDCRAWAMDHNKVAKGSMNLKLSFEIDPCEVVKVGTEISIKKPKRAPRPTTMWLDDNANPVPHDPRQQALPGVRLVATQSEQRSARMV